MIQKVKGPQAFLQGNLSETGSLQRAIRTRLMWNRRPFRATARAVYQIPPLVKYPSQAAVERLLSPAGRELQTRRLDVLPPGARIGLDTPIPRRDHSEGEACKSPSMVRVVLRYGKREVAARVEPERVTGLIKLMSHTDEVKSIALQYDSTSIFYGNP